MDGTPVELTDVPVTLISNPPMASRTTPVVLNDLDENQTLNAGDEILLTFSTPIKVEHIHGDTLLPGQGYSFGTGFLLEAISPVEGMASTFKITLGTGAKMAHGQILTIEGHNVISRENSADLPSLGQVHFTIYLPPPAADIIPPTVSSAAVNGNSLVLTFDEALGTEKQPNAAEFTVKVNGTPVAVTAVLVNGTDKIVTLTLATAVTSGQVVTVSYTDGNSEDNRAIIDIAGNAAANWADHTVGNNTPPVQPDPVEPSVPTPPLIDGIPVTTTTTPGANGQISQTITIPIVPLDRLEDRGEGSRADIPLITSGSTSLLEASLPPGVGVQVNASSVTSQTSADARLTLIRAIESRTGDTGQQADRIDMTETGSVFLSNLPTDTALLVRVITPTVAAGTTTAPDSPIVITGSTASSSHEGGTGPQVALVIDVRGLPAGSVLQLQDVEFAAIIGAITVTGGDGRQVLVADGNSQVIFLGADDDMLHAGGGDDLVGSAGGNDLIYGEAGNDRLFGGAGNDTLDGGAGIDAARFDGAFANFAIIRGSYGNQTVDDQGSGTPEGTDTLLNVEILRFGNGVTLANLPVQTPFTEALYLAANPAAQAAVWSGAVANGIQHFVQFGAAQGWGGLLSVDEGFIVPRTPM